jgi:histidinol-phosphate aminotransferase
VTEPIAGAALRYVHPDYLDEASYATIRDPAAAKLDLLSLVDERGLVRTAELLRPLFRSWAEDPASVLPYPVADPHWRTALGRLVLDAFGGASVPVSQVFFGDGTYELFKELAGFVLRKGVLLGAGPVYPEFAGYFAAAGGRFAPVMDETAGFPAEALRRAIDVEPDAVAFYADLPYNATGGLPERDAVLDLVAHAARRDVIAIVDEAYANFIGPRPSYVGDVARHPNLVVLRSLSKGFDLRGLRFGFTVAGERVAPVLERIRSPYAPSQPSARAGRELLTRAPDVVRPLTEAIRAAKARTAAFVAAAGLVLRPTHPDVPNVMIRGDDPSLAERFARAGARVARGSQFRFTTGGALDHDVRLRVPLSEGRLVAFERVLRSL